MRRIAALLILIALHAAGGGDDDGSAGGASEVGDETRVTAAKTDHVPPGLGGRPDDGSNGSVHSGRIPTAGEYRESLHSWHGENLYRGLAGGGITMSTAVSNCEDVGPGQVGAEQNRTRAAIISLVAQ